MTTTALPADGVRVDAPANSILRLNPITVLTVLLAACAISLFFGWQVTLCLLGAYLLTALAAGRLGRYLSLWLRSVVLLSVVIFALQALLYPGETVLREVLFLDITAEGIAKGLRIATMVMSIGSALILGSVLIDIRRLTRALEQRGTSPTASYIVLSTITMIPQLRAHMATIMDAQRARGIETDASALVRAKAFLPTLSPLILNSIVGVEERALTLEARGFSSKGATTSLVRIPDTGIDRTLRALTYAAIVIALAVRIWLWMQ